MSLLENIKTKLAQEGPLSFRDYMDICLYHPKEGYYTSVGQKFGLNGDYYTAPFVDSVFGESLALQFFEIWQRMGKGNFDLVEFGSGSGRLCNDILEAVQNLTSREFYNCINYYLIDKNPLSPEEHSITLPKVAKKVAGIAEIAPVRGCIFSNELVDNFAVHQVIMLDELMEVFVDYDDGEFRELTRPAGQALLAYFEELQVQLPYGYRTEVNLDALAWIKQVSMALERGYLITIDYGYPSAELYHERYKEGSLLCFHRHRINVSPYVNPGEQDITSHVNFSALRHWGIKAGLQISGFTTQAQFLLSLGMGAQKTARSRPANPLALRTLFVDMGHKIKVLAQAKNMGHQPLKGMIFSKRLI